jgi:hypothetical protein
MVFFGMMVVVLKYLEQKVPIINIFLVRGVENDIQ